MPHIKLPTPKSKLYKRDGNQTIFHTLEDAIIEGEKWAETLGCYPTITLETNKYYRFFGHGVPVHKNGKHY